MASRERCNRAFTLVELLVVIAIIGILVSLLLPAVQAARESARRTQCTNNLKQMGIAFHMHHNTLKAIPSGGLHWSSDRTLVNGVPADFKTQTWGWAYQILPYLEQTNVWQAPNSIDTARTVVLVYSCPITRAPTIKNYQQSNPKGDHFLMDYVGNGGTYGGWWTPFDKTVNSMDGPLIPSGTPITFANIKDGLSNVILTGEKFINRRKIEGGDCNDDQGYVDGWDNDTICFSRHSSATSGPFPPKKNQAVSSCGLIFGSSHNSMMSVFCDGSVHPISFNIDPLVWVNLCARNDANPIDHSRL